MHCFRKYVFERIETNNKKNIILEKVDRFVCENVWYFQIFCDVFAMWLIDKTKRISNNVLLQNARFWKIWIRDKIWCC